LVACSVIITKTLGNSTPPGQTTLQRHYTVSFLGMPLVDVIQHIQHRAGKTTISYDNRPKPLWNALFVKLHNVYSTTFDSTTFAPEYWNKSIQEWSFIQQTRGRRQDSTHFLFNGHKVKVPKGTFTIFSAVHYLESKAFAVDFPAVIRVFIEGQIWQVSVERQFEQTGGQRLQHLIMRVGTARGRRFLAKTDILTRHIAHPGARVDLWVDSSGLIVKGRFGTPPEVVDLELDNP